MDMIITQGCQLMVSQTNLQNGVGIIREIKFKSYRGVSMERIERSTAGPVTQKVAVYSCPECDKTSTKMGRSGYIFCSSCGWIKSKPEIILN
jgi:DNA-directed RNA polymerase subunit RPC12/RpoP